MDSFTKRYQENYFAQTAPYSIQVTSKHMGKWRIEEGIDLSIHVYRISATTSTPVWFGSYYGQQEGVRRLTRDRITLIEVREENGKQGRERIIIRSTSSNGSVHEWLHTGIFVGVVVPSQPVKHAALKEIAR